MDKPEAPVVDAPTESTTIAQPMAVRTRRPCGAGLLIAGVVWAASSSNDHPETQGANNPSVNVDSTRFENAFASCDITSIDIQVADEGASLIMDGPPDGSPRGDQFITDAACVLTALETPTYVIHNIDNTNSLMGLQEAEWSGIHAQWSYHPDNGLDLVLNET